MAAALTLAGMFGRPAEQCRGAAVGLSAAWLASSLSTFALIWTKAVSAEAFWWAFGGGMALRAAALGCLMAWSARAKGVAPAAMLVSYALGVLVCLMVEYRHIKLK